jgi:hypothetical protein
MNQKRNKIILFTGAIVIVGILIFGANYYTKNNSYYVRQCENALDKYDEGGPRPPQRICKITNDGLRVFKANEKPVISPSDKMIISVNLSKRLTGNLYDVITGEVVKKPEDNNYRFCFSLKPSTVVAENNVENTITSLATSSEEVIKQDYQNLLNNSQWEVFPQDILDNKTKGDTFICSKLLPLTKYDKISFFFKVPEKAYLKIGNTNINAYVVEISLLPDNLKNNNNFSDIESLLEYYKASLPILHLINHISVQ